MKKSDREMKSGSANIRNKPYMRFMNVNSVKKAIISIELTSI